MVREGAGGVLESCEGASIKLSLSENENQQVNKAPSWLVINSYLASGGRHKGPTVAPYKVLDTK
jgi:hypothetical protein